MTPSDYFDFGVLLFLLFGSFWCFMRGFISTLTYLLAPLVGIMVACRFRPTLMNSLGWSPNPVMVWFVWAILFAGVSLIVCFVTSLIDAFLKKKQLGSWNHLLGLIFGFVLTFVLTWFFAYGMMYFSESTHPMVAHSRSAKYLLQLAEVGKKTIPDLPEATSETTKTVYQMPETFIQRVQKEQKENSGYEKSDENTGISHFLDEVDSTLEPIFSPVSDVPADKH